MGYYMSRRAMERDIGDEKIFITSWMNRNTTARMPSQRAVQLRKKL